MSMQTVVDAIVAFFFSAKLDVILALIAIDLVLGVALALRTKTFDLRCLSDFLTTMIFPYVLVYMAVDIIIKLVPALNGVLGQGINLLVFSAIVASLAASIYQNFKALGISLPVTQGGSSSPVKPGKSKTSSSQ